VSQYWNDEANDAVHDWIVASERELPLWPHLCNADNYDDEVTILDVPGEYCTSCGSLLGDEGWLRWWHDNGEAISAFEAMCHEAGTQDQPSSYNALPAAIARKRGDAIEIELLGPALRPHAMLGGEPRESRVPDPTWADARALELYEQVCASPEDDGPRRVLADYLLERELPRGELLAHALAGSPAYMDMLVGAHAIWLDPIEDIVVSDTVQFDRGFLSEVELFAVDRTHRGHPTLNSLERIYVHAGSQSVLHPDMRALREIGPINRAWLEDLVAAREPWAIATLDIDLSDEDMISMLRDSTTLPALRHVILRGDFAEQAAGSLATAAWWRQLDRLTVVDPSGAPDAWHARRTELALPWLAVRTLYANPVRAEGWELAFGPANACEATLRGFTPEATRDALKKLLAVTPVRAVTLVASRHYTPAAVDAEFLSRDGQLVT
jgi:uncharacterized protein (TIGR02996 family)